MDGRQLLFYTMPLVKSSPPPTSFIALLSLLPSHWPFTTTTTAFIASLSPSCCPLMDLLLFSFPALSCLHVFSSFAHSFAHLFALSHARSPVHQLINSYSPTRYSSTRTGQLVTCQLVTRQRVNSYLSTHIRLLVCSHALTCFRFSHTLLHICLLFRTLVRLLANLFACSSACLFARSFAFVQK